MKAAKSKLTSKYQTTIPKNVRKLLLLKQGDEVLFSIHKDGTVTMKKATPRDIEYLESLEKTLSEWNSKNDEDAYEDL
jgi:antitoxin PrlF